MKITDKIKSYEDAAKALGLNPDSLPEVSMLPEKDKAAIIANYKLWVIAEALNEGWNPDWTKHSEYKYYPWFDYTSEKVGSVPGFAFDGCGYDCSSSRLGSRLCFKSRDLAEYAGEQFTELYKTVFVIQ